MATMTACLPEERVLSTSPKTSMLGYLMVWTSETELGKNTDGSDLDAVYMWKAGGKKGTRRMTPFMFHA